MTYKVKMDKFKVSEDLKELIENKALYTVLEHEESDASLIIEVGKKKFVIQIKEIS